jgi:glycosyltransferase involved in cell wall biosynthesis
MNPILVSALIPTRSRPERLKRTIRSLLDNALNPERIEFCLRVDDDDAATLAILSELPSSVMAVTAPRIGYNYMGSMVADCVSLANGQWVFLIDDDCAIDGHGWDEKLSMIKPDGNYAQCEFYHLGGSRYPSDSCGPVGMILPMNSWVGHEVAEPLEKAAIADNFFRDTMEKRGWKKNLLKNVTYRHMRDNDEELKEHRK